MNNANNAAAIDTQELRPKFGAGRYSALGEQVFEQAQVVFNLAPEKAEQLAKRAMSEIGAIMQGSPVSLKIGKVNKDGKVTISEAAKLKGVTLTNTLLAVRALNYAAEAGMNGFKWGHTKWSPVQTLSEFFDSL